MAGTVTVTRDPRRSNSGGGIIEKIKIEWTSDASGNADSSITGLYGWLVKVVTDPVDGPTASYDITLVDENSSDAAESTLLNRDTANIETVYPAVSGAAVPVLLCGTHTFTVANAGNAKSGVCYLYLKECL